MWTLIILLTQSALIILLSVLGLSAVICQANVNFVQKSVKLVMIHFYLFVLGLMFVILSKSVEMIWSSYIVLLLG